MLPALRCEAGPQAGAVCAFAVASLPQSTCFHRWHIWCRSTARGWSCAPTWRQPTQTARAAAAQHTSRHAMQKAWKFGTSMLPPLLRCLRKTRGMSSAAVSAGLDVTTGGLCSAQPVSHVEDVGEQWLLQWTWILANHHYMLHGTGATPPHRPAPWLMLSTCPAAFCTTDVPGYSFQRGKVSAGQNIGTQRTGMSAKQLGALCGTTPGCVGFSSDGWLKSRVRPAAEWVPTLSQGACDGLFMEACALCQVRGSSALVPCSPALRRSPASQALPRCWACPCDVSETGRPCTQTQ